ncbi:MAG: HAMP domain-containing sensor histidine kinase [Clostridium perfringens]|nr:HAMP domain-containing sensor histidine kinase [Clostridium perfringens]
MKIKKDKRRKNKELSSSLAINNGILIALILIFLNFGVYWFVTIALNMENVDVLNNATSTLQNELKDGVGLVNSVENIGFGDDLYGLVFNSNGDSIYKTNQNISIPSYLAKEAGQIRRTAMNGKHVLYMVVPVVENGQNYYVFLIKDKTSDSFYIELLGIVMALTTLLGIIIALIAGKIITRRSLRPMTIMRETAEKINGNNLKDRIDVKNSDDEIGKLAGTINNMMDRIEERFEMQNRFVGDASHELKTPIAVIKGYADMLDRWGKDDREVLEEAIAAIKKESDHMKTLIDRLLFLAKKDSELMETNNEKLELNNLIDEVVQDYGVINNNSILRRIEGNSDSIVINADRDMIKQLLRIFIDNSIKYTNKENGFVKISVNIKNNESEIIIEDNGIGIPKKDIDKVFERFYRVDKGRSRELGGSGLGLSIAAIIINHYKGKVELESIEGVGTKAYIKIPLYNKI